MENNSFSENEIIKFSPKLDNQEIYDSDVEDKINTSNSYSVPTSSMYYNSEEDNSDVSVHNNDIGKEKKILTVANPDENNSDSQEHLDKSESIKDKILPKSLTSNDKRNSTSLDKKSDVDASSIVVEINDADDDFIDTENDNSFVVIDPNTDNSKAAEILKKKLEKADNRNSLATTGDLTCVDNNQTARNSMDLSMPEKSDIVNTNLKRLTDTTSVPPIINDKEKENPDDIDKATADISNKEHKIAIDDDIDDNTCAICLIETQKPTDIENIGGSNETVVVPTKEDIDNYECKLHCMHKFHYSCIAQWLERNQNCPICRVEIKRYEIEAIEKRFDISIKVKNDDVPLVVPHYNTTFEFDIPLTIDLVKNYMSHHFSWINFKAYFYTRFFFYFIGFLLLTIYGIIIDVISFRKGHEKYYFTFYIYTIILIIGFIIFLVEFIYNVKRKNLMLFMIKTPGSSSFFYGLVTLLFIMIFVTMTYLTETKDLPFTKEKVFEYILIAFFGIMLLVAYVEVIVCYNMFKEEDRRIVDADVSRRNEEIMERNRREEAEEREEFERNFSHLND